MNKVYIGVVDLETTSVDIETCEPTEAAVKFFDPITLEPVENGSFETGLMKPMNLDKIDPESLAISKIKLEDLEKAPSVKVVWPKFIDFINKFNRKKNKYEAPLAAGMNIRNFDLPIIFRMTDLHCKKNTMGFTDFRCIDLMDLLWMWFEGNNELTNYKMETVREYFGLPKDGQHRAMPDVEHESEIIMRFLKLHRRLMRSGKIQFKGVLKELQ